MDPGWSTRTFCGKIWPRHCTLICHLHCGFFCQVKVCPYHTGQDIRQWPRLNSDHDFLWWLYPSHPPPPTAPPPTVTFWQFQPLLHTCQRKLFIIILGIFSICLIGTYGNDRRPLVAKVDQLVAPEPVCRTISTACILNTNMLVALLIGKE